jgi:hypothetical protein
MRRGSFWRMICLVPKTAAAFRASLHSVLHMETADHWQPYHETYDQLVELHLFQCLHVGMEHAVDRWSVRVQPWVDRQFQGSSHCNNCFERFYNEYITGILIELYKAGRWSASGSAADNDCQWQRQKGRRHFVIASQCSSTANRPLTTFVGRCWVAWKPLV